MLRSVLEEKLKQLKGAARQDLARLLQEGQVMAAIRRYRKESGVDLHTAEEVIHFLMETEGLGGATRRYVYHGLLLSVVSGLIGT